MSLGEVFAKNRQVIPRWHTYPMARWLGVTFSPDAGSMKALPDEDYSERVRSWQHTGNLSHAADLVGNALGVTLILTPIIANCVSARHCRES